MTMTPVSLDDIKRFFTNDEPGRDESCFQGVHYSDEDLKKAFDSINQQTIIDESNGRFSARIHQKNTSRFGIPPGDDGWHSFAIERDGRVIQVQSMYPGAGGHRRMTRDEAEICMTERRQKSKNSREGLDV
jgi:hypothetical protein